MCNSHYNLRAIARFINTPSRTPRCTDPAGRGRDPANWTILATVLSNQRCRLQASYTKLQCLIHHSFQTPFRTRPKKCLALEPVTVAVSTNHICIRRVVGRTPENQVDEEVGLCLVNTLNICRTLGPYSIKPLKRLPVGPQQLAHLVTLSNEL
jgi:hypothetical protein